MYCIDGIRTLKNRKPTLKYSRFSHRLIGLWPKTVSTKNAKAKTFGVDLANSFEGFSLMGEGGTGAPAYAIA